MLRHADTFRLALQSLLSQRRRSLLICLATGIGVAAVVLLTALGDGARRFVTGEFASLGTNLLIVIPGRNETVGGPPPVMGETPRDLTIGDGAAVAQLPSILRVVPVMVGAANISTMGGTEREAMLLGVTSDMLEVRHLQVGQGRFLPALPADRAAAVCVLGPKLARELFENESALGKWLRVGDRRFRVVGILAGTGVSVGQDFNDMVQVPVASAQALLNTEGLFRLLIETRPGASMPQAIKDVRRVLSARHDGEEDVTLITQDSVVATSGKNPAIVYERKERGSRLLAAVRALPLGHRQVVTLLLEGLSQREIAEVLGTTENAVNVRASRARSAMRALMEDETTEEPKKEERR